MIIMIAIAMLLPMCAKFAKKTYAELDDKKLIECNVHWNMVLKLSFLSVFTSPILFGTLYMLLSENKDLSKTFLCIILIVMGFLMGFSFYVWELVKLSKIEIETRKFKKNT